MSADLVKRLKEMASQDWARRYEHDHVLMDAAQEIEDLREAIQKTELAYLDLKTSLRAEREYWAELCEQKVPYMMAIPCPDGIPGCAVFHSVPALREKTGRECAADIRKRGENG